MKTNVITKTSRNWCAGLFAALSLIVANQALAQNLPPPVSGLQILNLAGTPIGPDSYAAFTTYTADFVASTTASTITFVFRHDPGFFEMTDVSVSTGGGPNLIVNGDFSVGAPTTAGAGVPDWTYFIQAGNLFPQYLGYENGSGLFDGSTQAYDGVDQTFATVPGDLYNVSFELSQEGNNVADYQPISDNGNTVNTGGNGIDVVVYAGNGLPPTTTPDAASTMGLLGAAVAGLAGLRRKLA
jgi:hypothetical protein